MSLPEQFLETEWANVSQDEFEAQVRRMLPTLYWVRNRIAHEVKDMRSVLTNRRREIKNGTIAGDLKAFLEPVLDAVERQLGNLEAFQIRLMQLPDDFGRQDMTAREEEQMTTAIDQKESLRRMIDNRTAAIRMALNDLETNMRELVQYEARLHATTGAPPDVREADINLLRHALGITIWNAITDHENRKGQEVGVDSYAYFDTFTSILRDGGIDLAALPSAPPNVREDTRTTARKIEDAIDNAFDTIGPRISAESVKRVVLAALPSAPVLPTRSQIVDALNFDFIPNDTRYDEYGADQLIAAGFARKDDAAPQPLPQRVTLNHDREIGWHFVPVEDDDALAGDQAQGE